ncbi:hypothetical protein ACH41E_32500 [Streptomyces sp. NPDC020412]|uniref:hypothetical protein n=1 Tax=Streptomyces sp. NPDC020412 TaxID=3365073 RepID=UPI0037AB8659
MDDEIQLIRDGDGLAVIGNQAAVEHFLVSKGLPSQALRPRPFRSALGNAAGAAQAGSDVAAHSSRWVKLSKESARSIDKYGLRESAKTGLSMGVLKGDRGQIKSFVEFAKGAGPFRGTPAVLANVAAMMAQLAMQQAMDEITDYLATIDEKVDDVRRAQEDDALSKMIGAEIVIDEVTIIRDEVGRVSDITWSKVQATSELHPAKSPAVVQSANRIVTGIEVFHGSLGIESGGRPSDTRRWTAAAGEARDKALETGAKGIGAARNLGNETLDRASSVKNRLASGIVERARRRSADGEADGGGDKAERASES